MGTLLTNIAIFVSTSDDLSSTFFPERSIASEAQGFIDGPHYTYWVLLIFALMSVSLVLLSAAWLSKFERGPLEMVMWMAYEPLSKRRDARIIRRQAQQFRDSADHL